MWAEKKCEEEKLFTEHFSTDYETNVNENKDVETLSKMDY